MDFVHAGIMDGNEASSCETWRLVGTITLMAKVEKRQRMMFRCLRKFLGLFHCRLERIVAQIFRDLCAMRDCRKDLVAFPAAQGYSANSQHSSRFRLEDFELEPASAEVATNGGRHLWHLYATVAGW